MSTEAARPQAAEPLIARLKAATAHLHTQIERVVPLMRADLDRAAYRHYLERLLGFLSPLEHHLGPYAATFRRQGIDFDARRKTHLLIDDLHALGATDLEALPVCSALPAVRSIDEAWGCLYVLEGSTLGGQIIQRTLAPRLELTRDKGLRFLVAYAEQTGSSWKAFCAALAAHDEQGCDSDAAIRGAAQTFKTQMAWLAGAPTLG